MLNKLLSLTLSAMLALPLAGQGLTPVEAPAPEYVPLTHWARLAPPQVVEPGQAAPEEPEPMPPAGKLTIDVLAGEGAQNDTVTGEAAEPRVMVLDASGNPVADAVVVFETPMEGPSANFSGWVRTQTVRSGRDGVAAATNYAANDQTGSFAIQVTARSGNNIGSATISQTNAQITPQKSNKKWKILGIALGIIGGGVLIGTIASGDGDSQSPGVTNGI